MGHLRALGIVAFIGSFAAIGACAGGNEPDSPSGFNPGDEGGAGEAGVAANADGATTSPATDGAAPQGEGGTVVPEGGGGSAAIPCGSSFCRADETCTNSACALPPCMGPSVPGDYASIAAAITALANTGTDVTICLKAQTYAASTFAITDVGNHQKNFKLVGVSPDATIVQGMVTLGTGFASASITGVTIDGQSSSGLYQTVSTSTNLTVTASKLRGTSPAYFYSLTNTITLDGVDVMPTATTGTAIYAGCSSAGNTAHVVIRNSFVHDASYCGEFTQVQTTDLSNNTFLNCQNALFASGAGANFNYFNNIVAKATATAVNLQSGLVATHGNNALWGNMTNYAGMAVAGTGYVTSDCMLDTHAPPGLGAGSPCKTAGDMAHAPPVDFYDVTRPGKADIGAVESP